MRSRWGLGSLGFLSGLVLLGAGRAPINDILVWTGICSSDVLAPRHVRPRPLLLAGLSNASAQPTPQPPVSCPPPPTAYQTLPSIGGTGDVSVALALGAGPGIGDGNQNLCFVAGDLPAAPVIRIQQGNQLTVKLTNTLVDTGPDNTENCPIENYTGGPPISNQCSQPEAGFKAAPGPDGAYYPIQTNIPMLADGTTNLHVHGVEVSPLPCRDDVLHSTIYPANWEGAVDKLLRCQNAPNELTYRYNIASDHPAGLYFYHTHRHGQALAQTMMGASGPIVVEGGDDLIRAAHGVTDDVMIVRDFPSAYVSDQQGSIAEPQRDRMNRLYGHPHGHTAASAEAVDPRIDRDNEVACPSGAPDTGGPSVTRLTLNGALVQETTAFPPPDDQVLVKTMVPGERQIWRLVNAAAQTYISPQLVLSQNGKEQVLPLVVVARDGVPVHDDDGWRRFETIDTSKHPFLLATANRVEFLVHAPPPGATLYLDSVQVTPGCAADGVPARRLLRAVSSGEPTVSSATTDADIQPQGQETELTHMLDMPPSVTRVFAFTEYPRSFTVAQSDWIIGPPADGQFNPNATDFYLTMIESSDGQGQPVQLRPFDHHSLEPDVVVHLNGKENITEDWVVQNYTLEVHDFHIHQVHFRDVTKGDGVDDRAPILDTVNVAPATRSASSEAGVDVPGQPGIVRLRMKFSRSDIGEFVFHCHVLAHEDKGMMQKIRVVAN
jgi:FtsP/CotA-like multicopper oxidase with cupredoxin domain